MLQSMAPLPGGHVVTVVEKIQSVVGPSAHSLLRRQFVFSFALELGCWCCCMVLPQSAAAGCCEMSMALCTLEPGCWHHCSAPPDVYGRVRIGAWMLVLLHKSCCQMLERPLWSLCAGAPARCCCCCCSCCQMLLAVRDLERGCRCHAAHKYFCYFGGSEVRSGESDPNHCTVLECKLKRSTVFT